MQAFEYKVVPAPHKGTKAKGVKTPETRFANSIEITLNEMAAQGWDYQRAETLPCEERQVLTGKTVTEVTQPDGFELACADGTPLLCRAFGEPILHILPSVLNAADGPYPCAIPWTIPTGRAYCKA